MENLITDELHPNSYRWAMDNKDNMTSGNRYHGDIIVAAWLHAVQQ